MRAGGGLLLQVGSSGGVEGVNSRCVGAVQVGGDFLLLTVISSSGPNLAVGLSPVEQAPSFLRRGRANLRGMWPSPPPGVGHASSTRWLACGLLLHQMWLAHLQLPVCRSFYLTLFIPGYSSPSAATIPSSPS